MFSVKAVVVMTLYLVILPGSQRALHGSQSRVTVKIARVSVLLLAIGVTMIGLAWNIGTLVPGMNRLHCAVSSR